LVFEDYSKREMKKEFWKDLLLLFERKMHLTQEKRDLGKLTILFAVFYEA
jgi:hypothetical protein